MLENSEGMRCVGEAGDAESLLELVRENLVDVVLLDIGMPGPGVVEVIRQLIAERPRIAVLILSGMAPDVWTRRVLEAGAMGFVDKVSLAEELPEAIRQVASGGRFLSPSVTHALVNSLSTGSEPRHIRLSDREMEVLRETARGTPVKVIATRLGISAKTVSTYRGRVLEKLELPTQADAIRYALEHGIVDGQS